MLNFVVSVAEIVFVKMLIILAVFNSLFISVVVPAILKSVKSKQYEMFYTDSQMLSNSFSISIKKK